MGTASTGFLMAALRNGNYVRRELAGSGRMQDSPESEPEPELGGGGNASLRERLVSSRPRRRFPHEEGRERPGENEGNARALGGGGAALSRPRGERGDRFQARRFSAHTDMVAALQAGINIVIGPVTAYSASAELLRGAAELRRKHGLLGHIHLLETRVRRARPPTAGFV